LRRKTGFFKLKFKDANYFYLCIGARPSKAYSLDVEKISKSHKKDNIYVKEVLREGFFPQVISYPCILFQSSLGVNVFLNFLDGSNLKIT